MDNKQPYAYTTAQDLDSVQPLSTIPYIYGDANWKDKLTAFAGYAYLHSLQEDVTGLVDMTGTQVVQYAYTAWGISLVPQGSLAGTLGKDNPFRHRGYVWDDEAALLYLRSRYYYAAFGRFLNADTLLGKAGAVLNHNLFAYCNNNPMNRSDPAGLASGSPFERDESPWYYSDVTNPSQADMILANNGYQKDGVTASTQATSGEGELYVPALNATFMVTWGSIGKYHLDIWPDPDDEGSEIIISHFGFTTDAPGTMEEWRVKKAWTPVEAYLQFHGTIVAGSVNLMLHSGSGGGAVLNTAHGNICFYTYVSRTRNPVIKPLIQKHRDVAVRAYEFALKHSWLVRDR